MTQALNIELIEQIAKQDKEQLQSDALRTIRQKDPERGMAFLNQIEGMERLVQSLRAACCSPYYRQTGEVRDVPALAVASVLPIRRKAGRPPALRRRSS